MFRLCPVPDVIVIKFLHNSILFDNSVMYDNNFKINVYFGRYGNGALVEKNIIGQITPQSNWTKHTLNYNVPAYTDATSYSNDYVEIGLDLNPLKKFRS